MKSPRIDVIMVEQGLVSSRTKAQDLIRQGSVVLQTANEQKKITSPSWPYTGGEIKILQNNLDQYVSRAGLKLEGALERLSLSVADYGILDLGISTGGFADCLLQKGANKILGVEVGHSQLDEKLKKDSRITVLEGLNARYLDQSSSFLALVSNKDFDLCVIDVSFISLTYVLPQAAKYSKQILALVKPQFEVGPGGLGKGGVVKDASQYPLVEEKIRKLLLTLGWQVKDYFSSRIEGKDGNKEFFVYATRT